MTITQWLKNHADGGFYTADEIAAAMNMATSYVEGRLRRLAMEGVVEWRTTDNGRVRHDKYRLAEQIKEAA